MKYTTLFFDADETLYDFKKAGEKALKSFHNKKDIPCSFKVFRDTYEKENFLLWNAFEEGLVTAEEVKVQRFENTMKKLSIYNDDRESLSQLFISELAKYDDLLPGVEEMILKIKDDYTMLIITNGFWDVQKKRIGESKLFRHFDNLIVSEKVGFAKPDKGIFDFAFQAVSNPQKKEVLIIGDSLSSDIKGGNLYGIDTCWYNPENVAQHSEIRPTYEVHSIGELEELLSS